MKNKLFLGFALLFTTILVVFSCNKDDDKAVNCVNKTVEYSRRISQTKQDYESEKSIENCKKYKKALEEYLAEAKKCSFKEEDLKTFEKELKALECE